MSCGKRHWHTAVLNCLILGKAAVANFGSVDLHGEGQAEDSGSARVPLLEVCLSLVPPC